MVYFHISLTKKRTNSVLQNYKHCWKLIQNQIGRDSKFIVWNIDTGNMSNIISVFIDSLEPTQKANKLFYKYLETYYIKM